MSFLQRFSNADHLEVHENKHQIKFGLQFPGRDQFLAGGPPFGESDVEVT